ncbi:hypothetical protein Plhal304r1_c060g0146101 [Plasmopara halstedii]
MSFLLAGSRRKPCFRMKQAIMGIVGAKTPLHISPKRLLKRIHSSTTFKFLMCLPRLTFRDLYEQLSDQAIECLCDIVIHFQIIFRGLLIS